MNSANKGVPIESLLAHRDWVRRLARALARDESGADDLEQETWLRALRHPPAHAGSLRGWLGTVLRRLAEDQRRTRESLARREEVAARRETPVPSPADLVAEAEAHRLVVEAVLSLEEPYRATVLLRWFEDLPPTELARRLGVPLETVRARLRRAGERLRESLGGDRDGGDAWKAVLVPLVQGHSHPVPPGAGVPWKGVAIMTAKSTAAVAAGAALALGLAWWLLGSSGLPRSGGGGDAEEATRAEQRPGTQGSATARPGPGAAPEHPEGRPSTGPDSSGGLPGASAAPLPPTRFESGQDRISGRVMDPSGRPAAGVRIQLISMAKISGPGEGLPAPTKGAETDDHGRFGFDGLGAGDVYIVLRLDAPGYLKTETWVGPGAHSIEMALVPSKPLRGIVVDGDTNAGVEGILVLVRPVDAGPEDPAFSVRTGPDGGFALEDLLVGRYSVEVGETGPDPASPLAAYLPAAKIEGVDAGTTDLRVVLSKGLSISGVILDAAGRPVTSLLTLTVLGKTDQGAPDYSRYRFQALGKVDAPIPPSELRTPFDGTFTVPGLPPGKYDLTITPETETVDNSGTPGPVSATTMRDVPAGTEGLRVTMRTGKPLTGSLVDEQGDPVTSSGYIHVYFPDSPPGTNPVLVTRPKVDGTFATPPLDESRTYELLVITEVGYREVRVKGLHAGDPPVRIILPRAASIAGTVQDEDGKPVGAGIPVHARDEGKDLVEPDSVMRIVTQSGGTFRLDDLGDRSFTLVAGGGESAYASGSSMKGVKAGAYDVVLRVKKGSVISGTLQESEGQPFKTHYLGGAGMADEGGLHAWTRVDSDEGRFTLRGLPAGKVRLYCYRGETRIDLGVFTAPAEGVVVKVPEK